MSEKQISFHWDKHHRAYFNNLGNLLKDKPDLEKLSLEELIVEAKKSNNTALFNNAAQAYNHNFFWKCINADGSYNPSKHVKFDKYAAEMGGVKEVLEQLSKSAATHFGSGWAWLVINKQGKMEVKGYHDADTPIANGETPLLTIDVWEHSYYIDYQNRRPNYIENFFRYLVNFDYIEANIEAYEASKK